MEKPSERLLVETYGLCALPTPIPCELQRLLTHPHFQVCFGYVLHFFKVHQVVHGTIVDPTVYRHRCDHIRTISVPWNPLSVLKKDRIRCNPLATALRLLSFSSHISAWPAISGTLTLSTAIITLARCHLVPSRWLQFAKTGASWGSRHYFHAFFSSRFFFIPFFGQFSCLFLSKAYLYYPMMNLLPSGHEW